MLVWNSFQSMPVPRVGWGMSNQLYIGAHIDNNQEKYNDVFSIYQDAVQVPSFTTKAKSSPAQPAKIAFRDVNSSTPHREDIVWLADNKISEGWKVGDSYEFRGMDTVKRQDMAAFLRREAVKRNIGDAATWKPSAADWKAFRDVNEKTPHADDILWLAHAGISTGWAVRGGKEFRGMNSVVRQDMAAFLHRLDGLLAR